MCRIKSRCFANLDFPIPRSSREHHIDIAPLQSFALFQQPRKCSSPSDMRFLPLPSITRLFISSHRPIYKVHLLSPLPFISRNMSTMPSEPVFSSNYDPEEGTKDVEPLLRSNGGKWRLVESGKGVERSFKFKTFKKTWVSVPNQLRSGN